MSPRLYVPSRYKQHAFSLRRWFPLTTVFLSVMYWGPVKELHADGPVFKSAAVRMARSSLETTLADSRKDLEQKVKVAHQKYLEALESAIRQATKAGDLDEANKLDQELTLATSAAYAGGIPTLTGTWRMRWGNRGFTNYTFHQNGSVTRELAGAATHGVLKKLGNDIVVDFGDQSLMRVNISADRLILEYWEKQSDFPKSYPNQFGVCERNAQ